MDNEEDVSPADLSDDLPTFFFPAAVLVVVLFELERVFEDFEGFLEGPIVLPAVELGFFGVPIMDSQSSPEE